MCPFSAKIVKSIDENLLPILKSKGAEDKLSIILRSEPRLSYLCPADSCPKRRQVPQPWHHSSTFVHQAAVAVSRLTNADPAIFWSFTRSLMADQASFFDEPTVDETPNATKQRLASKSAEWTNGKASKDAVYDLVLANSANKGSKVDADLKLAVKYHRQTGVHVTPTVSLDGLIDPSVSSSFGKDEWTKWLDEKVLN